MDYFWNKAYDEIDANGKKGYSKEYYQKSLREKAHEATSQWDVVHQCRDLSAIERWMDEYKLPEDPKYLRERSFSTLKISERK
jgi:hypothetical protein